MTDIVMSPSGDNHPIPLTTCQLLGLIHGHGHDVLHGTDYSPDYPPGLFHDCPLMIWNRSGSKAYNEMNIK